MRLVILEAESLGKDMDLSGFSRFGEVTVYEKTTEEECPERVREADIVICNKVRMCSRTLSGAENLKLICVTATGINNIDLDYVKRHNIAVTNVAGYSTVSVAQHTFAMYFYLAEKLRYYDDYVKNGSYAASRLFTCMDRPFTELEGRPGQGRCSDHLPYQRLHLCADQVRLLHRRAENRQGVQVFRWRAGSCPLLRC